MVIAVNWKGGVYQLKQDNGGCESCALYSVCKLENPSQDIQTWCQYNFIMSDFKGRRAWIRVS